MRTCFKSGLCSKIKLIVLVFIASCGGNSEEVKIGTQVWMAKNLDVEIFRNGDSIKEARTDAEWEACDSLGQPAWCYFENDIYYGKKFGKLYNWYAVNDPRGLAPKGWHIPSDIEWAVLSDFLGGDRYAGVKMKSKTGWGDYGYGTNSSGFKGFPGGFRTNRVTVIFADTFRFNYNGLEGIWWSSTESR